jgi:hypothetical protein
MIHRKDYDVDPVAWAEKNSYQFSFSKKTSTTSLRPHIEKHHLELFLRLAAERGWKVQLPGLVSQARSQAASEASASQGQRSVEFSEQKFQQYLLNFIIADDQVRDLCFFHIHYAHVSLFRVSECRGMSGI